MVAFRQHFHLCGLRSDTFTCATCDGWLLCDASAANNDLQRQSAPLVTPHIIKSRTRLWLNLCSDYHPSSISSIMHAPSYCPCVC